MKFSIEKNLLRQTLVKASFGLPKKSLNPIFDNFVFEIEDSELVISATDSLTTARVFLDNIDYTDSSFRVLMPASKLLRIAKEAPDGEIDFDIAPRKAVITSRRSEWVLNLPDASKFPELPSLKNVPWKPVARQPFIDGCSIVMSAASFDQGSPGLCMVNVSNNVFRAADRLRMHQFESDHAVPDISIPSFEAKDFITILKYSSSEELYIARGSNGFAARVDNLEMVIAGQTVEFPDVSGMLLKPTLTNDIEASVDVGDLTSAIRRTRITADEDTRVLRIKVSQNNINVSTKESSSGNRTAEDVECLCSYGGTVTAFVNYSHLEAALKSSPTQNVTLTFAQPEGSKLPSVRIVGGESGYNAAVSQIRMELL